MDFQTFDLNAVSGISIEFQRSHFITKNIIHFLLRFKINSVPSETDEQILFPTNMRVNAYGIVLPAFVSTEAWVKSDKIIYCYIGSKAFSFRRSELVSGEYVYIDYLTVGYYV